ncbi:MAG: gluconate 2-dehydrogenase subunit 3 family protein [Gemmatimonas sp.]
MTDSTSGGTRTVSRRDFMAGLGAVWLSGAMACARSADNARAADTSQSALLEPVETGSTPREPPRLLHFSAAQGVEVEALSARIIPSDDSPGAREAGVVYFIDQGIRTFAKDQAKTFDEGLVTLSKTVAKKHKGETKFSALTAAQQDDILRGMERTEFFGAVRFATIAGFLALPKYGGNKDYIGWKHVGQDHTFEYTPPFGWYDRPENQQALLGRVL